MTNTCAFGTGCILKSIGMFVIWWSVASALVWLSWNKVIGSLFKVKQAKFWQALLLLGTICLLCAPCSYLRGPQGGFGHEHGGKNAVTILKERRVTNPQLEKVIL